MKLELANLLQSYDPNMSMEVRKDYSGRGMCGKETAAVITEPSAVLQADVSIAIREANSLGKADELQEDALVVLS